MWNYYFCFVPLRRVFLHQFQEEVAHRFFDSSVIDVYLERNKSRLLNTPLHAFRLLGIYCGKLFYSQKRKVPDLYVNRTGCARILLGYILQYLPQIQY